MQETLLEQDFTNIDFSNIAALQQKRTLAFVNHFVITTVQFLNNFMKSCEQKLMHFERKLEKVNAAMVLLEAKLSSIPEVNVVTKSTESEDQKDLESKQSSQPTVEIQSSEPMEQLEPQKADTVTLKPEYERFVKMVQVGVPLDAVKLKVSLEGLDPLELEQILKK